MLLKEQFHMAETLIVTLYIMTQSKQWIIYEAHEAKHMILKRRWLSIQKWHLVRTYLLTTKDRLKRTRMIGVSFLVLRSNRLRILLSKLVGLRLSLNKLSPTPRKVADHLHPCESIKSNIIPLNKVLQIWYVIFLQFEP